MTDPSPEVVAAALALAEAFTEWDGCLEGGERRRVLWVEKVGPAKAAYRAAVAPKRSRAEVDRAVVAAALALAEASVRYLEQLQHPTDESDFGPVESAINAYRAAIAPKRTRAEVDAEIATVVRVAFGAGSFEVRSGAVNMTGRVEDLCREETAPEPDPARDLAEPGVYVWSRVPQHLWAALGHEIATPDRWHDMRIELIAAVQAVLKAAKGGAPEPSTFTTRHGDTIDLGTEDACGCDASDALRERLGRVESLVNLWTLQVADYPKTAEGEYAAAGVRCCIRELKEALEP